MIISASRRTDIPAFYSEWFMNRIRAGYCTVPNPFNRNQVSVVSLKPEDVDVIVFWTRNPRPLFRAPGRNWIGAVTATTFSTRCMDNPRAIDPKSPSVDAAIKTFRELADRVGSAAGHLALRSHCAKRSHVRRIPHDVTCTYCGSAGRRHATQCHQHRGHLQRRPRSACATCSSKVLWSKKSSRMQLPDEVAPCLNTLLQRLRRYDMEIFSCAEELDLLPLRYSSPANALTTSTSPAPLAYICKTKKDPSQREACGCVVSKDIGMYDTCLFGCQYCYATSNFESAKQNHADHDPLSPSLIGWHSSRL